MKLIFKLADVLSPLYPNIARALRELEGHERQLCVSRAAREDQIRRQITAIDYAGERERRVRKVLDTERDERRAEQAEQAAVIARGLANEARLFPKARAARPTSCGAMDDEVRAFATHRPSSTRFNIERYDTDRYDTAP